MASLFLTLVCPIDGLEFDLASTPLQQLVEPSPFESELWSERIGGVSDLRFDTTARCPNGHGWGINYALVLTRSG
jgi:hypothetical protein